jgi:4-aminobutyrate aminotransferase-like enzyme
VTINEHISVCTYCKESDSPSSLLAVNGQGADQRLLTVWDKLTSQQKEIALVVIERVMAEEGTFSQEVLLGQFFVHPSGEI